MKIIKGKIWKADETQGEDLVEINFVDCKIGGGKFVKYRDCKFDNCDLGNSEWDSVAFENCKFVNCKLSNVDWGLALFVNCEFRDCLMINCIFHKPVKGLRMETKKINLKGLSFWNCDLSRSVMVKCELKGVVFENVDLTGVVLDYCNLTEVDLSDCVISGINFETSIIKNTKLSLEGMIEYGLSKGLVWGE